MPDHHTLSELSTFHRDLEAPEHGVTGEKVDKDCPPYRFSDAVKLELISLISNPLVGRGRWTDREVLHELDILFSTDTTASVAFVT